MLKDDIVLKKEKDEAFKLFAEGKKPIDIIQSKNLKSNSGQAYRYYRWYKLFNNNANSMKNSPPVQNPTTAQALPVNDKVENFEDINTTITPTTEKPTDKDLTNVFKSLDKTKSKPEAEDDISEINDEVVNKEQAKKEKPRDEDVVDLEDMGEILPEVLDAVYGSKGLSRLTAEERAKMTKHANTLIEKRAPAIITKNADIVNVVKDVALSVVSRMHEANSIIAEKKQKEAFEKQKAKEQEQPKKEEPKPQPQIQQKEKIGSENWTYDEFKRWQNM